MFDTKRCPQCDAEMFADIDVCFECMHDVNEGPTSTAFEDAEAVTLISALRWSEYRPHLTPVSVRITGRENTIAIGDLV